MTGVYRPPGTPSVWLFVAEYKSPDRTAYVDSLQGDTLYWQGQTSGRTDALVRHHERDGLELLLFYRKRKDEYPEHGFRYEGPFRYLSHTGERPTTFVLQRVAPKQLTEMVRSAVDQTKEADDEGVFDPASLDDAPLRGCEVFVFRNT
jgi:putative restriction endonuclease